MYHFLISRILEALCNPSFMWIICFRLRCSSSSATRGYVPSNLKLFPSRRGKKKKKKAKTNDGEREQQPQQQQQPHLPYKLAVGVPIWFRLTWFGWTKYVAVVCPGHGHASHLHNTLAAPVLSPPKYWDTNGLKLTQVPRYLVWISFLFSSARTVLHKYGGPEAACVGTQEGCS